jgi:MarR family transcriptional regulator, 2-MHQ and catechol-resistance regulon repressor
LRAQPLGTIEDVSEPWDDDRITAFGMLIEAHAAVAARVGRDLEAAVGLPVTWFEVLLRLARSEDHQLRMTELAAQVAHSTSGLTRLVDRIEQAGYIRREACHIDRRGSFAVLTEEGQEVLRRALPGHLESLDRHLAGPLGDEVCTLSRLLRTLRDAGAGAALSPRT